MPSRDSAADPPHLPPRFVDPHPPVRISLSWWYQIPQSNVHSNHTLECHPEGA